MIDNTPMLIVFAILAVAITLWSWGRPRTDIVALLVVLGLLLSHVLTPQEAFAGFGDPVVILIAAVFVVGAALENTGIVHRVCQVLLKLGGGSEIRLIVLIMLFVGGFTAFMSTTAVTAMFIPVVIAISARTGLNRKRLLMPLAVAATIGSMMTLISSPPNMIVVNILRERGLTPPGFFSFTPFGLSVLVVGIAFMLLGRGLLSKQSAAEVDRTKAPGFNDLIDFYGLTSWWNRLQVPEGSPLIGRPVAQLRSLYDRFGVTLVGFEKIVKGKTKFLPALPETIFEANDTIFVVISEEQAPQFIGTQQLIKLPRLDKRQAYEALQEFGVAEVMLAPGSMLIGKTVSETDFRSRYHVSVMALRHRREQMTRNLGRHQLDFGDTLLIAGAWNDISRLGNKREDFVVLTLSREYQERLPARRRAPVALAILAIMVVAMASGLIHNTAVALLTALAMLAARCVSLDNVYRVVSWKTVVLVAGMIPLATALSKTGITTMIAHGLVTALGSAGPTAMLVIVFLAAALVGLFLTNSATTLLIVPVAIEAAQALGVSPIAFAMTVVIACSASFVTPVSSPWNLLVMEPGGYSFGDFVKIGLPLLFLTLIITVTLVRLIYHF
jgi:di/tricarboxylate transporter